jgi:DNA ligase (NAD+)
MFHQDNSIKPKLVISVNPNSAKHNTSKSEPRSKRTKTTLSTIEPNDIDECTIIDESKKFDQDKFIYLLTLLSDYYYNECGIVSDEVYDQLLDIYEAKYGHFVKTRAVPWGETIKLKHYIGSLDKIKKQEDIEKWLKTHPGPYLIMDKVDGMSILTDSIVNETGRRNLKLYATGDGYEGQDVSNLINYVKLPKIESGIGIRGEMVVSRKSFNQLKNSYVNPRTGKPYKNARNATSGIVNASKKNVDPKLARELSFWAFVIMESKNTPEEQANKLTELGFDVPNPILVSDASEEFLHKHYEQRKIDAPYDIDGLVIYQNISHTYPVGSNPDHVIAFKGKSDLATVRVKEIIWTASKDRLLKPVIHYDNTELCGATLKRANGFNARTIVSNNLGPGAKIIITRSNEVMPEFVSLVEPAPQGPSYPDPNVHGKYFWNDSRVELVLYEDNNEVLREKLGHFVKTLGVKNAGRKRLGAMIDYGITDIQSLLSTRPEEMAKIPGIGPEVSKKIHAELHAKISNVPLATIMAASCIFPNIGETRFESILDQYPDLLYMADTDVPFLISQLQQVQGIETMAIPIAKNLPIFVEWLNNIPEIIIKPVEISQNSNIECVPQNLEDEVIVFSGFRDKNLELQIKERGGRVASSVSKKTTRLVVANMNDMTSKPKTAKQLNIPIIKLQDFVDHFIKMSEDV